MGWKTKDMLEGLEGIMNLAAASGEDLGLVSDIVTDGLTALGLSAKESGELADVLAAAASNSNTNIAMMGETLKYAAPIFGTAGYNMRDFALAAGLMANAGIKASMSGTSLRAGLTRLLSPPKKAAEALKDLRWSITNVDGTIKPFNQVIDELRVKFQGLSKQQQISNADALFGKTAMSGWLAIIKASPKDLDKLKNAIENSNGAAMNMADIMNNTLSGQLTLLKSQLEGIAIQFGDIIAPYIGKVVNLIQNLSTKFYGLDIHIKKIIVVLAILAAGVGPLLMIAGAVISAVGSLIVIIGFLTAKLLIIVGVIGVVVVEWIALIAVVVVLAKKAGLLKLAFEGIKNIIQIFASILKGDTNKALDILIKKFGYSREEAVKFIAKVVDLRDRIMILAEKIKEGLIKAFNFLVDKVKEVTKWLYDHRKEIMQVIEALVDFGIKIFETGGKIAEFVKMVTPKIMNLKETFIKGFNEIKIAIINKFEEIKLGITNKFNEIKTRITNKLAEWETGIRNWFNSLPSKIVSWLIGWKNTIVNWLEEQNRENKRQYTEWANALKAWFTGIPQRFNEWFESWKTKMSENFEAMKTTISEKLNGWWEAIHSWFTAMPGRFENGLNNTWKTLKTSFDNAKKMIEQKLDEWWKSIQGWFTAMPKKHIIKSSGRSMITKVSQGNNEKKNEFMDKLGKLIVDVLVGVGKVIFIVALATGREIIKRVIDGIQNKIPALKNSIKNIVGYIVNPIKALPKTLFTSGKNLIGSLIDGIKSKFGDLKDAVAKGAGIIGNFLGFSSPTKEGPGSQSDKWMPNLMKMLSETMLGKRALLQDSIKKIAGDLSFDKVSADIGINARIGKNGLGANGNIILNINNPSIFDRRGVREVADQIKTELQPYLNFKRG